MEKLLLKVYCDGTRADSFLTLEFLSGPAQLPPNGSGTWQVRVTNSGQQSDTYNLSAFGPLAAFAQISPAAVALGPGQAQTVQLTASGFTFAVAARVYSPDYLLGVRAQSQTQGYIQAEAVTSVAITAVEAVAVGLQPAQQIISDTLTATFWFTVTNSGSLNTTYQLSATAPAGALVQLPAAELLLAPGMTASLPVNVTVSARQRARMLAGSYPFTITAESAGAAASGSAILIVVDTAPASGLMFLLLLAYNFP